MPAGRPTTFTQKLGDAICLRIAEGESLRSICNEDGMPSASTVFLWLLDEEDPQKKIFSEHYATARASQAEQMFEELLEIADESKEIIVGDDKSDGARVQANKLRVDTRNYMNVTHYSSNFLTAGHLVAGVKKLYHLGIVKDTYGQVVVDEKDPDRRSGVSVVSRVDFKGKVWTKVLPVLFNITVA